MLININYQKKIIQNQIYLKIEVYLQRVVKISPLISAYARVSVNPFKNIIDNLAIASNIDSLNLRKPLEDHLIGKILGQWKL